MSGEQKPYDWIVSTYLSSTLAPDRKTAFLRPEDVQSRPLAALAAIRALILDGYRVVIGRKKEATDG